MNMRNMRNFNISMNNWNFVLFINKFGKLMPANFSFGVLCASSLEANTILNSGTSPIQMNTSSKL
jgi:hypothetical protein